MNVVECSGCIIWDLEIEIDKIIWKKCVDKWYESLIFYVDFK